MKASLYRQSLVLAALLALPAAHAASEGSPEKQTLEISKMLRPISDEDWEDIAGNKSSEKYRIESGDTLFGISKRLFGDARYWPKVWALNNDTIMNPHLILPGHEIAFMPGTGVSLPRVSVNSSADEETAVAKNDEEPGEEKTSRRPRESGQWRTLPERPWEYAARNRKLPDADMISTQQALTKNYANEVTFERPYQVTAEPLVPLGEIDQAPQAAEYLSTGDQVIVHPGAGQELQIGTVYAITRNPATVDNEKELETAAKAKKQKEEEEKEDEGDENNPPAPPAEPDHARLAHIYKLIGEMKILNKVNGDWVGQIISARTLISRGDKLIPALPRLKTLAPVPAPAPLPGFYVLDPSESAYVAATGQFGFVSLGSQDGVTEGMLLQSFQAIDPMTSRDLIKPDLFSRTTLEVYQVSETFSLVRINGGRSVIGDGDYVKLLTDVSAFGSSGAHAPEPPATPTSEPAAAPPVETAPAPAPSLAPSAEPSPQPWGEPAIAPTAVPETAPVAPAAEASPVPAPPAVLAPVAVPAETPVAPPPVLPQTPPAKVVPKAELRSMLSAPVPPPEAPPLAEPSEAPPATSRTASAAPPQSGGANDLDPLDDADEQLGPDEERELKQLERYKPKESELPSQAAAPAGQPETVPTPAVTPAHPIAADKAKS